MAEARNPEDLSRREREVIDALSRPLREGGADAKPASNQAIAGEVFLSLDAVKGHLRTTYAKLGLEGLPQNEKRTELARLAAAGELEPLLAERAAATEAAAEAAARALAAPAARGGLRQLTPTTVLAGMAFVLLAALALARVVPGDRAPAGDTALGPGAAPERIVTQPRPSRPSKRGATALGSAAILPVSFSTEVAGGESAGGDTTTTTELAPRVQRKLKPTLRHVRKVVPKLPVAAPRVTVPATVTAPAAPKAVHCVTQVTRVTRRVVVWRRVPRRVKVRIPHRKVRIERTVYYTRKKVVTFDRRGRKHVTWVRVRHVRITRHPYVVYRVHYKRRMVRVRKVVTRVQLVRHRNCT